MPWKFSGDEILFWVRLHEYKEAVSHIAAFKKALVSFPERWKRKEVPLRLKATAWVAGFPVTNSEVFIETGEIRSLDFIGPSIDTGFRLTKFSSPQKFVLSADLALMFLDAMHRTEVPTGDFHLFYEGSEPLKGVLGGEPYPIVWIDMDGGILSLEERLLGVSRETKPHLLREFLAKFVDGKMIRPFIDGDDKETYGKIPAGVEQRRDRMMAMENQTKDAGEEGDIGGVDLDLPPPEMKGFLPGVV